MSFFLFMVKSILECKPTNIFKINLTQTKYKGQSKSYKPNPEIRVIAEHFCCGNTQQLLIKVEKIIHTKVIDKSKIWLVGWF